MISDNFRHQILIEAHRGIEAATASVTAALTPQGDRSVSYPPNSELTGNERAALRDLVLSDELGSAVHKVVADACGAAFFHLFSIIDGVADPKDWEGDVWLGVRLQDPPEDDDESAPMLHDDFFETYWDYVRK